jgi:undecaprenyl-diphosphatase
MVPSWLQALILGVVQGLTEFIPVSSSGHLVLLPYLLGWERPGLAFDVALHAGTFGAILVYFRAELWAMVRGFASILVRRDATPEAVLYRHLGLLLVVASVPVAVIGLLAKDQVAAVFENPLAASGFLLLTAVLLVVGERARSRRVGRAPATPAAEVIRRDERAWEGSWVGRLQAGAPADADDGIDAVTLPTGADTSDPTGADLQAIGLREAIVVGLVQMLALLPGVSRSGATISAGMMAGMTREAATRFSFLLALPALIGASALSLPDLAEPDIYTGLEIVGGVLAAFVSGYLAIRYLVALVARDRLTGFAKYVVAVAIVGFLGYLMIGPPSSV